MARNDISFSQQNQINATEGKNNILHKKSTAPQDFKKKSWQSIEN
jgi:hypothetical protein